jgi:hypothetical protein
VRFILGIVVAGMVVCPSVAETNSTNFKIQMGKIILAQGRCDCSGANHNCRAACKTTACDNACDAAFRACVQRC